MNSESILDIPCSLNRRILLSIRSASTVAILGAAAPLELPVAFVHVLMAFVDAKTPRDAFHDVDIDIDLDLDAFGEIVTDLCRRDLLQQALPIDDDRGLPQILNPRLFTEPTVLETISSRMQQGHLVIIPDALPAPLAEAAHRELCASTAWSVAEGGHDFFHYRASMINRLEGDVPALHECARIFSSRATRRFVGRLSGHDCEGDASVAAAWYRPHDYALPHDDSTATNARSVAFVWYLTKDWQREWGGSLFWCPTGQYISPRFNMLLMFNVTPSNMHFVCPVAATATARRLTINGFWTRPERGRRPAPLPQDVFISPPSYGSPAPAGSEPAPVIIL